jgi:DNA primase
MSQWIDFRKLRMDVDFPALLRHYQVKLRINGAQGQGFCPLPTHRGQRKSPSFSVNFDKRIWQCFGCKARGNAIDFAVRMEGHKPSDTRAVREVAEMLVRDFLSNEAERKSRPAQRREMPQQPTVKRSNERPVSSLPVLVNPPLDFKLQNLDASHPYLKLRHLKAPTIEHFGLGFCSIGMLKDRIAIPLHDAAGKLIGYAGRVIDDALISEEHPKYRFPGRREYRGKIIEFHKSLFLYNGYRVRNASNLLVVEGFPSTWWLWQCGYPNVVSLMGSSCSKEQATLIVESLQPDGVLWIMTDADDAGDLCVQSIVSQIGTRRKTQRLQLQGGRQPTDVSLKQLRKLIPFGAEKSGASFKHRGAMPGSKHREV